MASNLPCCSIRLQCGSGHTSFGAHARSGFARVDIAAWGMKDGPVSRSDLLRALSHLRHCSLPLSLSRSTLHLSSTPTHTGGCAGEAETRHRGLEARVGGEAKGRACVHLFQSLSRDLQLQRAWTRAHHEPTSSDQTTWGTSDSAQGVG